MIGPDVTIAACRTGPVGAALLLAAVACASPQGSSDVDAAPDGGDAAGVDDGVADGEAADGETADSADDAAADGEVVETLAGTLALVAQDVPLTPVGSARQPDVAFHGGADAFVAAYTWVLPDAPTPRFRIEVRAVTVDDRGTPAASAPLLVDGDAIPHDAGDVAVAAPPVGADAPALVAWTDDRSAAGAAGAIEIYGRLLAVTGGGAAAVAAVGEPFVVSGVPGTNELVPAAAWDAGAGRFLVAWGDERERGIRDPDARVVFARTVSPAGELGPEVRVGDEGLFQTYPQVASCGTGVFLVAYTDYYVDGPTLVSRYRGRLHDAATGAPLSGAVTYGEAAGLAQETFGLACNRRTGGWVVAWTVPGPPSIKQVATAVLTPEGLVAAGPTVVTAQPDGARAPRLAWVHAVNGGVLSPLAQDSTFGYLLELDPAGAPASPLHTLTPVAPSLGTHWSAVAAHGTRPLALALMTLDYQRVHATVLLGGAVLP
jgi:hypothetical protein